MSEKFLDGKVELHSGDCLNVLKTIADNSLDSCVCDPPYHLTSIVKRFGNEQPRSNMESNGEAQPPNRGAHYKRLSKGFMGKVWDGGDIAFQVELWEQVYRVLKPGAHLVAFSGTRTYHKMVSAIDDAGFEIRDQLAWVFGSGFPKSHDVSKGIDRELGLERGKVRVDASVVRNPKAPGAGRDGLEGATRPWIETALERGYHEAVSDEAVSDEAVSWQGWGTALKPAWEPIVLARKPLIGTVAENVLTHGTGALNIDGCRVESTGERLGGGGERAETAGQFTNAGWRRPWMDDPEDSEAFAAKVRANVERASELGRWPANLVHDGSAEVLGAFPTGLKSGAEVSRSQDTAKGYQPNAFGAESRPSGVTTEWYGDEGSAARFFYTAKADSDDRLGSKHPTVKPLDLMQWLVRLVTPPNGTTIDPFAGTGTTGEAAWREGMRAVLIERESEYQNDIRRRMALVLAGPDERNRESLKAAGKVDFDAGPLFGGKML